MKYIVFDIDGVVANIEHRVPLIKSEGWDAFYDACYGDICIEPNALLLSIIIRGCKLTKDETDLDCKVVFFTGRDERIRVQTVDWFKFNVGINIESDLYMRKSGDYRPDFEIKKQMAETLGIDNIICVFEDRNQVVNMWREIGIQCHQTTGEGNF